MTLSITCHRSQTEDIVQGIKRTKASIRSYVCFLTYLISKPSPHRDVLDCQDCPVLTSRQAELHRNYS